MLPYKTDPAYIEAKRQMAEVEAAWINGTYRPIPREPYKPTKMTREEKQRARERMQFFVENDK